jgi:SWI/SNF chromatin-remodeling complex subunit SWI1
MNQWLQDPSSIPNSHAAFAQAIDPSMSFLQPPQMINPAHFQNPPYLNGDGRTPSTSYHNPIYQTNQVIPSKRPREDSLGASPRQPPGGLPGSRSQTPGQGPYPGFNQSNGVGPMSSAPPPFQHLQTSNNATSSPTVPQMNFSQAGGPQRVSTASPSPFSPQQGHPHASPGPSDHASRVGTPHDNSQGFMATPPFGAGFSQPQFNPGIPNGMGHMGLNPQTNMAQHNMGMSAAQRNYQMQLQAQARHMAQVQAQAQARNPAQIPGVGNPGMSNVVMNQMQQSQFPTQKPKNPEDFNKVLQAFMAARGRSVDLNPIICGRPIPPIHLYGAVAKSGGSQKLTKMNQWGPLAQLVGFPQPQQPQAAQEMQNYYMNNLAPYESAWQITQHKQRMAAQAPIQTPMQNQLSPSRDSQQHQEASQPGHQRSQSDSMARSSKMASYRKEPRTSLKCLNIDPVCHDSLIPLRSLMYHHGLTK